MVTQNIGCTYIRKHLQCKGLPEYYTGENIMQYPKERVQQAL